MRYGTVPIGAATGGLVDLKEGFIGFQMGSFNVECDAVDPADVTTIAKTVKRALAIYGTPALAEMMKKTEWHKSFHGKLIYLFVMAHGPAKKWEEMLLSLGVAGSKTGINSEEIAPLAKENVASP